MQKSIKHKILNPKPETNPKYEIKNSKHPYSFLNFWISDLFRNSCLGFKQSLLPPGILHLCKQRVTDPVLLRVVVYQNEQPHHGDDRQ